jgi:predicted DNA-binding transcriptional regulator YafY
MVQSDIETLIRRSMDERLVLRISYPSHSTVGQRDIEVRDIRGEYLRAWCHLRHSMRTFRIDRIVTAEILSRQFDPDSVLNAVGDWYSELQGLRSSARTYASSDGSPGRRSTASTSYGGSVGSSGGGCLIAGLAWMLAFAAALAVI